MKKKSLSLWVFLLSVTLACAEDQVSSSEKNDVITEAPESSEQQPGANSSVKDDSIQTYADGMFALYKDNRSRGLPNLITPDFLMLAYSQIRQQRIVMLENEILAPSVEKLLNELALSFSNNSDQSPAAAHNEQYILLLQAIWRQDSSELLDKIAAEYALIMSASGITESPFWGTSIDYSQFAPRGRYTSSVLLEKYFRTFRYASTVLYGFRPSPATGIDSNTATENAQRAIDLVARLHTKPVANTYKDLLGNLRWHFGSTDDLTAADLLHVAGQTKDQDISFSEALVEFAIENDRVPKIAGGVVDANGLEAGQTPQDVLIGWRLLPALFSVDSGALQQLVFDGNEALVLDCDDCPEPPENSSLIVGKQVKGYPSHLEILAILGSDEAATQLEKNRLRAYTNYDSRAQVASDMLRNATMLEGAQVALLRAAVTDDHNADAYASAAGFWVWQKYLNLLYQKQSYTVQGKNVSLTALAADRNGAWLAGATSVYIALLELVEQHALHDADPKWDTFAELVTRCVSIAKNKEAGVDLSIEDQDFLNELDLRLISLGAGADQPVIVDIHTNAADNAVVEVGTAYPLVRHFKEARGTIFNVKEFKVSLDKRLTVEKWREVLTAMETQDK